MVHCAHDREHRERPASRSHRPDRRQTVRALLDSTDQSLKRGARPGAQVWPTGFDLLDSTLDGGLRSGELVLLGGNEGSGKTTIAVQMVRNAVAAGRHGVVFSYEHSAQSLVQRLLALEAAGPPPSRRASTPRPPPTCTRCARCSRPRTPTAAASPRRSPASPTASTRSRRCSGTPGASSCTSRARRPRPTRSPGSSARSPRRSGSPRSCSSTTCRRCRCAATSATRPRGSRSSPR